MNKSTNFRVAFKYLAFFLALLSMTLGAMVLLGWYIHSPVLIQVHSSFVPMQYNTALGFLMGGSALWALGKSWLRVSVILGFLTFLVGALTLIEYISGFDLLIDELFMEHYIQVKTSHPGRMAPNTALCFSLTGIAVILTSAYISMSRSFVWSGFFGAAILGLGFVAFTGYFIGIETAYGWGHLTRMAIHTAFGFMVLGFCVFTFAVVLEKNLVDGLPYWLPVPIGVACFTFTVALWQALRVNENTMISRFGPESVIHADEGTLVFGILLSIAMSAAVFLALRARTHLHLSIHAKEQAEKATELKDKFVSLVSHDLQGPLATMIGFLKLVRDDNAEPPGEGQKLILDKAMESGQIMGRLIEDILNISRIQTGKLKPKSGFVDAFIVALKAATGFAYSAEQKEIMLINNVPEKSYIYVDSELFAQVIHNLVSNALKFCKKGDSVTLYIPDGEPSTIAIKDTGLGINPEKQKILFNHDTPTSTTGTAGERGTGFGLPLCHEIMKAHGGELVVESEVNKGTTFYARLPHVKPRVMIVDGDKAIHESLQLQLEGLDAEIIDMNNGREALISVHPNMPHLIITDLKMPVMDGFELIRRLKEDPKVDSIPIIVMASDSSPETRQKSFKLGAQDFINKPLEGDILLRAKRLIGFV